MSKKYNPDKPTIRREYICDDAMISGPNHVPKTEPNCVMGVLLEKRSEPPSTNLNPVCWGRALWWKPGFVINILCRFSCRRARIWLLVCARMNILPKDIRLMITEWIVNMHVCWTVKVDLPSGMIPLIKGEHIAYGKTTALLEDPSPYAKIPFIYRPNFTNCRVNNSSWYVQELFDQWHQ